MRKAVKETRLQQPLVPTSVGELLDKISILKIKQEKITATEKLRNINRELKELEAIWDASKNPSIDLADLCTQLKNINMQLWDIEDDIRAKESASQFDDEFIALARSVYKQNDIRAALKKEINLRAGSTFVEEKSYQDY